MRVLLIALVLTGCGGSGASAETYQERYGGSETVYAGIASNTDCDSLQDTFDGAFEINEAAEPGTTAHRSSTGYMSAANDRMQALGC